jgi:hypothetical protein
MFENIALIACKPDGNNGKLVRLVVAVGALKYSGSAPRRRFDDVSAEDKSDALIFSRLYTLPRGFDCNDERRFTQYSRPVAYTTIMRVVSGDAFACGGCCRCQTSAYPGENTCKADCFALAH